MVRFVGGLLLTWTLLTGTTPARALTETGLADGGWEKDLAPFLASGRPVEFESTDGIALRGVRFVNRKAVGTLLFLPGFSEPWLKYIELLHDLHRRGFEVLSYDHRGQGASPRLAKSNPDAVHLERFEDHISDLSEFLRKTGTRRFDLLGHSMGGAVALAWAERHPDTFTGRIVVNAPMLAIRTDPFPRPFARILTSFLVGIGLGERFAPTRGPRDPARPFEMNRGTTSRVRYEFERKLALQFTDRWVGGPTNAWVRTALDASERIARDPHRIRVPVRMLIPTDDHYAVPGELVGICRNLGERCRYDLLEGSRHEVFVESDLHRDRAIESVIHLLKNPIENTIHQGQ